MEKRNYSELSILLGVMVFSAACIVYSLMNAETFFQREGELSSLGYSNFLFGMVIVFSASLLVFSIITKRLFSNHEGMFTKKIIMTILVSIAYIFSISTIGFYISTFFFVFFIFQVIEHEKSSKIVPAVYSLSLSVLLFIVFKFFHIYLPDALLF